MIASRFDTHRRRPRSVTKPARPMVFGRLLACAVLVASGFACSASDGGSSGTSATSDGGWGSGGGAEYDGGSSSSDAGGGTTKPDLPPEVEKEVDFGAPEGSPNFVFVPVKGADEVVKVSGKTLKVTLVEVGDRPTVIKVVPGQDKVVVLNSGSDDVSVLTSTETTDDVRSESVLPHGNALSLDPTGNWAAVFYDHARAKPGDPVGSFQAISLVRVGAGQTGSMEVSVGFRPKAVHFTTGAKQALVVTDDGISIIELATVKDGDVIPAVPVSADPFAKPKEREVQTTPDGTWAVVRQSDLKGLVAVHLPTKKLVGIPMTSVPTDLDLSPDGSQVLAVLRDSSEVALVGLPKQATNSLAGKLISVKPLTAGLARITSDGKKALLYTSVGGIEQVATLDMATAKVQPKALRKTVDYVFLPKGGHTAVLVHKPAKGPMYDLDETEAFVDNSYGYTLFDLNTGFTKLVLTPVPPLEIVTSKGPGTEGVPAKAWLLLPDPQGLSHEVQEAALSNLLTTSHPLGSKPQHARYLHGAGVLAVTQQHPSGRITFIDTDKGTAKTVTGYELNGLVK
ncbi:MAG: hypothetical protein KC502_19630 [Myxococcales bacterium]|nr:hypothetical protein [Myxococcales bacterium]